MLLHQAQQADRAGYIYWQPLRLMDGAVQVYCLLLWLDWLHCSPDKKKSKGGGLLINLKANHWAPIGAAGPHVITTCVLIGPQTQFCSKQASSDYSAPWQRYFKGTSFPETPRIYRESDGRVVVFIIITWLSLYMRGVSGNEVPLK